MSFDHARKVADVVLYEGYVLYPYRASSQKNQLRWQFGVLVPSAWAEAAAEAWASQTECLLELREAPSLQVLVRFLQVQSRTVESAAADGTFSPSASLRFGDKVLLPWDEAVEREVETVVDLGRLPAEVTVPFELAAAVETETVTSESGVVGGRVVRRRWQVSGRLRISAERLEGPYGVVKLRVVTENTTPWEETTTRDEALQRSLVSAHTLMAVDNGSFLSLLEPPEWARPLAEACENLHTWPVLAGADGGSDVMLSSPIILYDHPATAPESPGDLFDATEIDEILTLRTLALTDAEKAEARATDERAAGVIDRVDRMPGDVLERLHGAIRYVRDATTQPSEQPVPGPADVPWWDPGADASVSPDTDSVQIGTERVSKGSVVRLRPGSRRADAQDMFLEGRLATVEGVWLDVDGRDYLAVIVQNDPAADLHRWHGRYLYFAPDEVEPVVGPAGDAPSEPDADSLREARR